MEIPDFDHRGLIPPFFGEPTSNLRSPYKVDLIDFIQRFSTTPERRKILDGLLKYRSALHGIGISSGFQWIDGSFLEKVETTQNRPPNDIDLVSFFPLPENEVEGTFLEKNLDLFTKSFTKKMFSVDAFPVLLDWKPELLIRSTAYWFSVWSHQRRSLDWKGFVEIDLDPKHDTSAREMLSRLMEDSDVVS